jgi:hypothetical protein
VNTIDANRQAALMGLYYHGEFQRRGLTPPASLPPELRVVDPVDAINQLEHDHDPGYESSIRLALAELASAHDAFATKFVDYVQRLAAVVGADDVQITNLPQVIVGPGDAERAQRYLKAYEIAGGGGCGVRNFQLTASYHNHISDVTTSIEVNRPVDDFVVGIDPRNWSQTLPDVWEDGHGFAAASLTPDRKNTPLPALSKTVPTFSSLFFEKADWSSKFDGPFAFWRTILRGQLDRALGAGTGSFIRFDYSLFECLENEFFGETHAGGIDVDHGHGDCRVVLADPTWSKLEARKAVRFTQPTLAINDLTFVFLILWFSSLILTSACA